MSLPKPEHTLWVGAAGTGTAYGLCVSARDYFGARIRIIAADINPAHLVAASLVADAFVQVPFVSSGSFPNVIAEGLVRHGVDTYQPILDEEIILAAEMLGDGRIAAHVMVMAPSARVAAICLDKLSAAAMLRDFGLPSPETQLARDASWRPGGLLVKPRFGRGSLGVQVVHTEAAFVALQNDDSLIVQETCIGPEVTIDAFRARNHNVFRAVCRERLEVKAGVCTKARVFDDDELSALAYRLCHALELFGTNCFQVMKTASGAWAITDINPRPGAGTRMSAAVGVDLLLASLLDVWGGDPRMALPQLAHERFVIRTYNEHVTSEQ